MEPRTTIKQFKVMPKQTSTELSESYKLSPEQLKYYDDNGFVVLKGLIDFTSLYAYKQRFIQIATGVTDRGHITVMKEQALVSAGAKGEDLINKLQDILFDDVFSQYTENPRLLNVVSQFVGDDISAMHSMFINKPPGTGRHPPHQDLYYFPFRPADKIVAAWTAVDDVYQDNGCLYVIPGSHKQGTIYRHDNLKDSNKMYHGIVDEELVAPMDKRVHLEMSPGDTVFFHPILVHGSGPNFTKHYRKCISCHFASSRCHFVSVRGTVQQPIADEIVAEAKRRGFSVSFEEAWRYRSKVVRGVQSHL